ncbi:MAG TPA: AMP-binding protein [Methylomirabilota bacterium]|nr:AMP-binding protein [Methylomirabilota bacterium]
MSQPLRAPAPVVGLVHELIEYAAERHGERPFLLRFTSGSWSGYTFETAALAVRSFTALLEREGVRPGARVGLQSDNRPEWGLAYLSVLAAGAVVVPLDAQLREQELGELLATAEATHAIGDARHLPLLDGARIARRPALRLVSLDPDAGIAYWDQAQREFAFAPPPPPRAEPNDIAVLLFTSGTTGQAKGVMLSHANLLSNVEAVVRTLEFGPADRFLSILPLHHTFESMGGLLCPLRVGASVCSARGLASRELREDMNTSGATLFIGVPLLYEKLLSGIDKGIDDAPWHARWLARGLLGATRLVRQTTGWRVGRALARPLRRRAGLDRLRMFVTGAAPFAPEVFWRYIDLGWPMLEGYGLTETSPVVCANRPPHPSPGAVGWPLPGIEVRVDEPDADGDGELVVRGPNVMLGYWRQPAMTAEVLHDGWFHTGDLGRVLPDGRVRITGRLKNMIATAAGKKIYPEEVELVLANSPYVLEVLVTGGADGRRAAPGAGEREEVHAHIYPNLVALEALARAQGKPCDDAFVERVLRAEVEARGEALAPFKRVKKVIVRASEFPKTTTGKIRRTPPA